MNSIQDEKIINRFRTIAFARFSAIILSIIGLYAIFVYFTSPEVMKLTIVVGMVAYLMTSVVAILYMNHLIKTNDEIRSNIIKKFKK